MDAALTAQAALLAAATCAGAYTRAEVPPALGYASLFAAVLALFLLWRRWARWPAHALLTAALCVLCVWGAATARPIVRVVWRGRSHGAAQQRHALYAASAVFLSSTALLRATGAPPLLAPLLTALAVVALDADAWDWGAAVAFALASALAAHLGRIEADDVEEALARAWGTPSAFGLVDALLTRPCGDEAGLMLDRRPLPPRPAPRSASVWAMGREWSPRPT